MGYTLYSGQTQTPFLLSLWCPDTWVTLIMNRFIYWVFIYLVLLKKKKFRKAICPKEATFAVAPELRKLYTSLPGGGK